MSDFLFTFMSRFFFSFPFLLFFLIFLFGCFLSFFFLFFFFFLGGLFGPAIVIGASGGRIVGIIIAAAVPTAGINAGVYAMLGAGSMLGGFNRLVMPAALMVVEITGDATYLLPIMCTTCIAYFTACAFTLPLYPQHMKIEQIPTLSDVVAPAVGQLPACQVMQYMER